VSKRLPFRDLQTNRFDLKRMNPLILTLKTFKWTKNDVLFRYFGLSSSRISFTKWWRHVRNWNHKTMACRAIIDKSSGRIIGLHLFKVDNFRKIGETTIIVGETNWHGKGVHREVTNAIIEDSFNNLGLFKLSSKVSDKNIASKKNMLAVGYKQEGVARGECVDTHGERSDYILFGLLRDEWTGRKDIAEH
jgi:RimJ/RimL family protein N-acetyltransferase